MSPRCCPPMPRFRSSLGRLLGTTVSRKALDSSKILCRGTRLTWHASGMRSGWSAPERTASETHPWSIDARHVRKAIMPSVTTFNLFANGPLPSSRGWGGTRSMIASTRDAVRYDRLLPRTHGTDGNHRRKPSGHSRVGRFGHLLLHQREESIDGYQTAFVDEFLESVLAPDAIRVIIVGAAMTATERVISVA